MYITYSFAYVFQTSVIINIHKHLIRSIFILILLMKKIEKTVRENFYHWREKVVRLNVKINIQYITFKINESRYVALFAVSGSIKKLFSIDYVNAYLFSIFFSIDFSQWKSVGLPRIAYIVIH